MTKRGIIEVDADEYADICRENKRLVDKLDSAVKSVAERDREIVELTAATVELRWLVDDLHAKLAEK